MNKIAELGSEMRGQVGELAGRQVAPIPPLWLRVGFWACIVIAVAAVIRRVFALVYPPHSAPPQLAALDRAFASHSTLTLAHILPALAFVVVAPFFVFRKSNDTAWPEHVLFPLGLVVGITAYAMSTYSVGRLGGTVGGSAV
jgi:cobalamin synthase